MSADHFDRELERGLQQRRLILGEAWVDQAQAAGNAFNADFQAFITRYAWQEVWARPGLPASTRRLIVLATTCALGRWEEFDLHCRAALGSSDEGSRLSPLELKELLLQMAIYAGVPAANTAMAHALKILRELGLEPGPGSLEQSTHPGYGRVACTRGTPSLQYSVREPQGRASSSTVVLSHALGCDLTMWDELAALLAPDYRVVCYDHRGHGGSDRPPGPYEMGELVDDACRLLDELGPRPVIWVGLSLGGMLGLELALREPHRIEALVMANACAGYDAAGRQLWQQRIQAVASGGMAGLADGAMQRWFSGDFQQRAPATLARARRRLLSTDASAYAATCHALSLWSATSRLQTLQPPTLLLAGSADTATPPAMSEAMAAAVPSATLHVLDGAAHLSVLEQPREFHRLLRGWLAELGGAVA